jgi:hypothetical protein
MFKVVTMVFHWIKTELSWAESEEDRIVAIIETHEAKWLLEFIGTADYDCHKWQTGRLNREGTPHKKRSCLTVTKI